MDEKELKKIIDILALYHCYGNLCTECTHEAEENGSDCCASDCAKRIYEVVMGDD